MKQRLHAIFSWGIVFGEGVWFVSGQFIGLLGFMGVFLTTIWFSLPFFSWAFSYFVLEKSIYCHIVEFAFISTRNCCIWIQIYTEMSFCEVK